MLLGLPREIITEIFCYLNYKYIRAAGISCYQLYCQLDKILKHKQRITKNYPRIEGVCKIHKIPDSLISLKDHSLTEAMLKITSLNLDLVKGDIIEFKQIKWREYQCIYNGEVCEELEYYSEGDGYLIDGYTCIEDDVPTNYWHEFDDSVSFNLIPFKDELLSNVTFDDQNERWFTTFLYNQLVYKIILLFEMHDKTYKLTNVQQIRYLLEKSIGHEDDNCLCFFDSNTTSEDNTFVLTNSFFYVEAAFANYEVIKIPIPELPGLYKIEWIRKI